MRAVLDPLVVKLVHVLEPKIERPHHLLFLLDMESGILTSKRYEQFGIKGTAITWQGACAAGRALPGDKVVWLPEKGAANFIERAEHILVGTLELNSKTRYGMTSRGVPLFLFQPYNEHYPPFYVGSSEKDLTRPQLAVVRFEAWELGSACPRGVLARALLGVAGDPAAEKQALLLHYGGAKARSKLPPLALPEYTETTLPAIAYTVSIDPPGCRDIDDAISLWQGIDCWNVVITIANVAAAVAATPAIFDLALKNGQTFYDCGRAVAPMLPPAVSEDACSLLEGKLRAGISLWIIYDPVRDFVSSMKFCETVVRVDRNHTYESVMSDTRFYGYILSRLFHCGSDSHEWVENAMLLYNMEFAKIISEKGGILRRHAAPDKERLEKYSCVGLSDLLFLSYTSAEYCHAAADGGGSTEHWGLGKHVYCHASSPIRRFADLYNQMIWRGSAPSPCDLERLNQQQSASKKFDRDCQLVTHLLENSGGQITAMILPSSTEKRLELWIPAWKQILKQSRTGAFEGYAEGDTVSVKLHIDPTKRSWKRRVVISPHQSL